MRLQSKVSTIFDRTNSLLAFFGASLIIFIMLAVCVEIAARYFLGYSMTGTLEITEYTLLYITFLGAAWLLKREGHVKMDLVLSQLKPRAQALVNIITSTFGIAACLVITWYGAKVTWVSFQTDYHLEHAVLEPPLYPIMVVIPVGCLLLSIQFLRRTHSYLGKWRASRDKEQRW